MIRDLDGLSRRLVPWLVRRRALVLGIALLVSAVGAIFAARLYADLRSGIEELLPESAPSVVAARTIGPRLHANARLYIDLEGADPEAIERFADDLAARLRALPQGLVESVDYRTDERDRFLRQFGLLYLRTEDIRSIRDRIAARIAWEKRRLSPLLVGLDDEPEPAPSLDFADLEARYAGAMRDAATFRKGYYQTPDGRLLVLEVRAPEASTGLAANKRLLGAMQAEVAALRPASYDPRLRVGYSGEVAELVEEQAALVADLASSTAVVLLFVLLALWLYYRRWSAIAAISGALGAGCATTFGLGYFLVGHLNANTAFLGSIVVGNGINVGIIVVARYLEERRGGAEVEEAIRRAWSATLPATFVAAFGAGLAYLSLASTDFRGFSQFGIIGAVGMALCWVSAYLLLPSLLAAIEARHPIDPGPAHGGRVFGAVARWVEARPAAWIATAALLLGAAGAAVASYSGDLLESDMTHVRAKKSLKSGALYWADKADQVFQAYLTPIVLRGESPGDLDRTLSVLDTRRRALGEADPLREVTSLSALVPRGQEEKVALVEEIRGMLADSLVARLDPRLRERALALRPQSKARPVTFTDLPLALRRMLMERDGTVGRIALAFPRKIGRLDLHELEAVKQLIRGSIDEAGAGVKALNTLFLISDIDDVIWRDGPRAALIALILVGLLVVAVLRHAGASATVMATLLLGLAGLVGIAAAARVRVNFLNFVVLPITFGIGVDYAVNIVQRYRQERWQADSLGRVLRETGSAVALCSATTIIGYASLMVADSQALAGFGFLAALGEVTCLFAALFILPAWMLRRGAAGADARVAPAPVGARPME